MSKTAIIGTGIAGMGCGHFLHPTHDLTLYEQNDYIGGHTNTVTVQEPTGPVHIDTGFMVFNYSTYPNLCRLFGQIGAPVKKTDMSFSVQHIPSGLEYSGSSLNHLFAQRSNLFRPRYWKMLRQIGRFNAESIRILDDPHYADISIGEYVREAGYGDEMLWKYLVPMSSAVWSTPMDKMLDFPAVTLIRFFLNHGFLGLDTQHQWWTLDKGSQSYRELLIEPFRHRIRVNNKVVGIIREEGGVGIGDAGGGAVVVTADGHRERYDRVILACHGDQALAMLEQPTTDERRLLNCFHYQHNRCILHTDTSLMPARKLAWSSWNYRIEEQKGHLVPSTIYWMNRLQGVSDNRQYFVSVNPHPGLDKKKILLELDYDHPLFDIPAIRAQEELQQLNTGGPVYFCGSYFNYGFHEDAFTSAVQLCTSLLQLKNPEDLWQISSTTEL
jgi:predicted NAD/FAD-binding protein